MVDQIGHIVFVYLLCLTGINCLNQCYDEENNTYEYCTEKCCGIPSVNSTHKELLPCCPRVACSGDCGEEPRGITTSIAGAVFTTVFSLVFLASLCLCFQRILSRARNTRNTYRRRPGGVSVREVRDAQRRGGSFMIATIGEILASRYSEDPEDIDEEAVRIPKPAEIEKQLPSYDEAIKSSIKDSPPPYFDIYNPQFSTATGTDNGAFHYNSESLQDNAIASASTSECSPEVNISSADLAVSNSVTSNSEISLTECATTQPTS